MKGFGVLDGLTLLCALGCALIAGLFFVFSNTIMRALGGLAPPGGIAAMQSINAVILNPLFLLVFMGTALVCVILAIAAAMRWSDPGSATLLAGAVFYVVGSFLVTMMFNVPRNNALAAAAAQSP